MPTCPDCGRPCKEGRLKCYRCTERRRKQIPPLFPIVGKRKYVIRHSYTRGIQSQPGDICYRCPMYEECEEGVRLGGLPAWCEYPDELDLHRARVMFGEPAETLLGLGGGR